MNFRDEQRRQAIRTAGCKPPRNLANEKPVRARERAWILPLALVLLCGVSARAQSPNLPDQTLTQTADESKGKTAGNYTIQQTVEFGYRDSMIGGNLNNYDTFDNLQSGVRLFDYTVDMRSINHMGVFFDSLTFSNFGYGGDPNDLSRLRIEKNKWYDFRALFRRDKNTWNYNLMANPLNPTSFSPAYSDRQFAARAGSVPPDAGLRPDSSPGIADPLPVGVFLQCR